MSTTRLADILPRFKPFQLIRAWRSCAGPALLMQARFLGVVEGPDGPCLQLQIPDPVWRQELEFQKKKF